MSHGTPPAPAPGGEYLPLRISRRLARAETWLAGGLVAAVFLLLMGNVVSRALGRPLIWTDELAIYLMVCAAFLGASAGLATRQHIAVMLLPDALPPEWARRLALGVDGLRLMFFATLGVLVWRWFDPVALWQAGSAHEFSRATFNFIYQEPTVTLGVRKLWFWLVLPVFCLTGTLHVAARLAETLRGGRA